MSQNLRPFDLGKLDIEGNRKRRRKKFLVWSAPVVVLVVLACLYLSLPTIAARQAGMAHSSGAYSTAATWLRISSVNTVYEGYKQPFNSAIIATNQEQFDNANELFRQAIASAPESQKCFIRVQSVLSSELAGDAAVTRQDIQAAVTYYTKALSDITTHPDCFTAYGALTLRIATKLSDIVNQLNEAAYRDQTATPESTTSQADAPTDEQLDDLEELQKKSQIDKQQAALDHTLDLNYKGKRW